MKLRVQVLALVCLCVCVHVYTARMHERLQLQLACNPVVPCRLPSNAWSQLPTIRCFTLSVGKHGHALPLCMVQPVRWMNADDDDDVLRQTALRLHMNQRLPCTLRVACELMMCTIRAMQVGEDTRRWHGNLMPLAQHTMPNGPATTSPTQA